MRPRTAVALLAFLLVASAVAVAGLGTLGADGTALAVEWVSDTGRDTGGNHHAPAAATVDGQTLVFAPVSGRSKTPTCGLFALDGATGEERWRYPIPAANCTVHSVADPSVADYDDDGDVEVIAATTERVAVAVDPRTGTVERRLPLSAYGYTRPVVADLTGDGATEVVVVDVRGTVRVFRPDGSVVWSERLSSYTWGQPAVADFDGDGEVELLVALGGSGAVQLFEADGTVAWAEPRAFDGSVTWTTTGQVDEDPARELVAATAAGEVALLDGRAGAVEWSRDLGRFAAVHAIGDGDEDGTVEVYAVARDARLRSVSAATGEIEWTTTLTSASVQMTPPPALGDVDGDGRPDLVAVTNDGIVSVVDPTSGAVRASYERDAAIYTHPTLADLDGDGDREILVMYGDGRVVALDVADRG